jgi:hypothetical protein
MNEIKNSLIQNRPTEYGGPTAQRGFTYQNDWAIKMLVDLHESDKNYALIIEYQDDVQIIDDIDNPQDIEIYQIKTTTSVIYKLGNLILGGKDKKSILTKLFHNIIRHKNSFGKAAVVSNASFECKLNDDSVDSTRLREISIKELSSKEFDKVCDKVNLQSGVDDFRNYVDKVFLIKSDMPINHTEQIVVDRLVKYFESNGTYSLPDRVSPLFSALRTEVLRKSNYFYEVNSYEELIEHKSITRDKMNEMLNTGLRQKNSDIILLDSLCNRLSTENASLKTERNVRRHIRQYLIDKSSSKKRIINKLEVAIDAALDDVLDDDFK